jgi:diaminohydroxyphosphoribosylaminopyrimidine deaminase/5-amino-6-(5-phosphoribosylamino)uracil reductase
MKNGISLDGKIATHTGNSRWITGEESRLEVHRMRDASDAVITGIGTVLADDPELTARLPEGGTSPVRVVVDSLARTPLTAKLVNDGITPTIIAVSSRAPAERVAALMSKGMEILIIPETPSGLDLGFLLRNLGQRCLTHVMVEAGGTLNSSFLFGNYVDKVVLFVAPKIIGGAGAPGPYGGVGSDSLSDSVELEELVARNLGEDLMIEGYVKRRESRDVYRTCGRIGEGWRSDPRRSLGSPDRRCE